MKKKVVILGGGMAAMAAAWELSNTAQLRNAYDITVYQMGWRLGGKCASTRGAHPADATSSRIEEHGLHVWFGFYFNSFRLMRDSLTQLAQPGLTVGSLFRRCSSTPMMEHDGTYWSVWPMDFPEDSSDVEPGISPDKPTLTQAARRIFRFFSDHLREIVADFPQTPTDSAAMSWLNAVLQNTSLSGQLTTAEAALAELFAATFSGSVPNLQPNTFFTPQELALLQSFLDTDGLNHWRDIYDDIRMLPASARRESLRRAWILADLALAVASGLKSEALAIAVNGLGALDDRDFREWLAQNKAHPVSVDSAPVRALYDLVFAYSDGDSTSFASADFAAGTALRCLIRITMGYSGAVCYTMNAGMGEAVIAPIYQALHQNGVRFEFFHRADKIDLDGADHPTHIRFTRQATTVGGAEYSPLDNPPGGLACWPRQPDFTQLVNGAALKAAPERDPDDESQSWPGETSVTLDLTQGQGIDVIVAVSRGSLPRILGDLETSLPDWLAMINSTLTVATQSAQLWLKLTRQGLGFVAAKPPAMIAAPEPMDVWADMTQVLASETWDPAHRPASVQYLCGPLAGNFADVNAAVDQVRANTRSWLDTVANSVWAGSRSGTGFNPALMVGTAAGIDSLLYQQHLRANYRDSERYVLSLKGSIAQRFAPDDMAAQRLYFAGDWTRNGLNAGCVEAAVMSGKQAARAVRGDPPYDVPGSTDSL